MRKSCLECVIKHLGSAAVYIEEYQMGYPNYFGFVYGQLDHAASECLEEIPDLAWAIREHRIKWANTRRNEKQHRIPFEAIFDYLDTVEGIGEVIEVPAEVYAGLDKGDDGKPVFSMDTRPSDEEPENPNAKLPEGLEEKKIPPSAQLFAGGGAPLIKGNGVPLFEAKKVGE